VWAARVGFPTVDPQSVVTAADLTTAARRNAITIPSRSRGPTRVRRGSDLRHHGRCRRRRRRARRKRGSIVSIVVIVQALSAPIASVRARTKGCVDRITMVKTTPVDAEPRAPLCHSQPLAFRPSSGSWTDAVAARIAARSPSGAASRIVDAAPRLTPALIAVARWIGARGAVRRRAVGVVNAADTTAAGLIADRADATRSADVRGTAASVAGVYAIAEHVVVAARVVVGVRASTVGLASVGSARV